METWMILLIVGVIVVMAIIGYFAEKTDFVAIKQASDERKAKRNEELAKVREEKRLKKEEEEKIREEAKERLAIKREREEKKQAALIAKEERKNGKKEKDDFNPIENIVPAPVIDETKPAIEEFVIPEPVVEEPIVPLEPVVEMPIETIEPVQTINPVPTVPNYEEPEVFPTIQEDIITEIPTVEQLNTEVISPPEPEQLNVSELEPEQFNVSGPEIIELPEQNEENNTTESSESEVDVWKF